MLRNYVKTTAMNGPVYKTFEGIGGFTRGSTGVPFVMFTNTRNFNPRRRPKWRISKDVRSESRLFMLGEGSYIIYRGKKYTGPSGMDRLEMVLRNEETISAIEKL